MSDLSGKVLIIDDDPEVRKLYAHRLSDTYEVVSVGSGEEADQMIDEGFDVVLLDRRMPGISGRETLSRFRDSGFTNPVALVTAVEPDFDILDLGFDDYVVKPVTTEELHELVERLLLRQEYDEVMREYFSLVSKVTALERRKRDDELTADQRYQETSARLDEIKEQARAALDAAIESGKYRELLKDVDSRRGR